MAVQFLPSQVDPNIQTTPLPYTASPLQLLRSDIRLFLKHILLFPTLLFPVKPFGSGELDELYPSWLNIREILLHTVLGVFQVLFLLSIPLWAFYPFGLVLVYVGLFILGNRLICRLLNGKEKFLVSNVSVPRRPEHEEERWVFVNGVGVGRHWLQSNLNRLAMTFGREVMGVHNPTLGVFFDFIQCLVERCFAYATEDVRNGFVLVRKALKEHQYKKIVLILHSQGAIEGGLMIDWLLADAPEVLFQKLEVYTFASAANHFSSPIYSSQTTDSDQVNANGMPSRPNMTPKKRAIQHIEHYANHNDIVSRWGVLNFTQSPEHRQNRFIGQVFERKGAGHQFNQHYLDNMFPFDPSSGQVADTNEFMETLINVDDDMVLDREPMARPGARKSSSELDGDDTGSAVSALKSSTQNLRQKPVKELSRLWRYRNGQTPD